MGICLLPYIPERLHFSGKQTVNEFYIGEELYYRCNPNNCSKPYQTISLYDVSHNRNFNDSTLYPKEDVLYNIDSSNPEETIPNKSINTTIIKSLSENKTYEKRIISENDSALFVDIKLIHKPVECMYPHCVFEISLNEVIVDKDNYSSTLDKDNKTYKNLRRDVRHELTSIIYSDVADSNDNTEIIINL